MANIDHLGGEQSVSIELGEQGEELVGVVVIAVLLPVTALFQLDDVGYQVNGGTPLPQAIVDVHEAYVLGLEWLDVFAGSAVGDDVESTQPVRIADRFRQIDPKGTVIAVQVERRVKYSPVLVILFPSRLRNRFGHDYLISQLQHAFARQIAQCGINTLLNVVEIAWYEPHIALAR